MWTKSTQNLKKLKRISLLYNMYCALKKMKPVQYLTAEGICQGYSPITLSTRHICGLIIHFVVCCSVHFPCFLDANRSPYFSINDFNHPKIFTCGTKFSSVNIFSQFRIIL